MESGVRLAVVGVGRIGGFHAQHAAELAVEGKCELVAVVDLDFDRAQRVAKELSQQVGGAVQAFGDIDQLIAARVSTASVIATATEQHQEHAEALIGAGQRVMLEKPMTAGLHTDREFARKLNRTAPTALMLAFQRRFDQPLRHAKTLLEQGAIGRPFKVVSILEDSSPVPNGYRSPGILEDMSIHNVDEVLWLAGQVPVAAVGIGSRIYSHRLSTADENYDDAFVQLWFDGEMSAQISVSRNHVPGYRNEVWVFGEEGVIHVGHFEQNKHEVVVEAYGRESKIGRETFRMRDYGRPIPEFGERFGPAYKEELKHFLARCQSGEPFNVDHNDGLRAMEVIHAASSSMIARTAATPVGVVAKAGPGGS